MAQSGNHDQPVRPRAQAGAGGRRPPPDDPRPGSLDTLRRFWLPVAIAAAGLVLATALWSVPLVYSALVVLAVAAAIGVAGRQGPVSGQHADQPATAPVQPDHAMRAIIDALARPAFLLDGKGTIRFVNTQAAAQFPGAHAGEALTMTFRAPLLREALFQASAGEGARLEYLERGKTDRLYTIAVEPVRQPGRSDGDLLAVLEDATERMAVARMRADFVANASHELRTPLASLTGFIETLQGPARGDAEASSRFLAIMLEQAERMRRLIDDLLSLSRVEMRAHLQPTGTVDLVAVVRHVADALSPLADDLAMTVNIEAPADPVLVRGDRDELIQVFENLIENGLKYGESGKRLDIAVTVDGARPATSQADQPGEKGQGRACVHIRDHGPGIAPEDLPRLTERFYRVDIETSRQKKGTGLGLAIVKHILARHQAELEIDSAPGEGARFSIRMELSDNLQTLGDNIQ